MIEMVFYDKCQAYRAKVWSIVFFTTAAILFWVSFFFVKGHRKSTNYILIAKISMPLNGVPFDFIVILKNQLRTFVGGVLGFNL